MSIAEASAEPAVAALPHAIRIHGQLLDKLPEDLYIPPDALEVVLEAFEGPLDLLLYLIRRQNLNILDIPVHAITKQYVQYIVLMQGLRLELAAEYLVMAALLAEIKSRILLPKPPASEESNEDPRMELVRRLQEYERFKLAAERLDGLPRIGRELHLASAKPEEIKLERPLPSPQLRELMMALREVLLRAELFSHHQIAREPLSVRERMSSVLARIREGACEFRELVDIEEGRAGVVVCLLAVLELTKLALIDLVQAAPFAPLLIALGRPRAEAAQDDEPLPESL